MSYELNYSFPFMGQYLLKISKKGFIVNFEQVYADIVISLTPGVY